MGVAEVISRMRLAVGVVGCGVSVALAILGVLAIAQPKAGDLPQFCHWLEQVLLFMSLGLLGCYLEARGASLIAPQHYISAVLLRVGRSLFYFWLGCCIMGEVGGSVLPAGKGWMLFGCVVGFAAWGVAMVSLTLSCLVDDADEVAQQEQKGIVEPPSGGAQEPVPSYGTQEEQSIDAPPGGWNSLSTDSTRDFGAP